MLPDRFLVNKKSFVKKMQNSHTIIIQKRFENKILQKFTNTSFISSVLGLQCLSVIT